MALNQGKVGTGSRERKGQTLKVVSTCRLLLSEILITELKTDQCYSSVVGNFILFIFLSYLSIGRTANKKKMVHQTCFMLFSFSTVYKKMYYIFFLFFLKINMILLSVFYKHKIANSKCYQTPPKCLAFALWHTRDATSNGCSMP